MDTRVYPGLGKRRPYVQWGENLYYLAPKCLYRGEYKRVWMCVLSPSGVVWVSGVLRIMALVFSLGVPFYRPRGGSRL